MPLVTGPVSPPAPLTTGQMSEAEDFMTVLRACHERRLEREGIPMVLGLCDERGAIPANTDDRQRAEGTRYADQFDRYSSSLVPWAREDDENAVIAAMQVVAYSHFAPDATDVSFAEEVSA